MLPPRPWELFRLISRSYLYFSQGVGGTKGRAIEVCNKGDEGRMERIRKVSSISFHLSHAVLKQSTRKE